MSDRAPVRFTVRHIGRSTIQETEMTDAPDMTALKPCPFCGGLMTHNNLRLARCKTAGCYMHNFVVDMDDAGSVSRWNTRAPTPADLLAVPEVAALVEAARWIVENDDAGDMFYHAQGKFAKRASAALAPFAEKEPKA